MGEKKRLGLIIMVIALAGIVTGLFLGHRLRLPAFMAAIVGIWILFVAAIQGYIAFGNWKKLIARAPAVGLLGIATGLFLGGSLLPVPPPVLVAIPKPPENEIWMVNRDWVPAAITVPSGTTVTWVNKELEYHTVTSNDGLFDEPFTEVFPFTYTFTKPGTYVYYCAPHPDFEPHSEAVGVVIVIE